jgi:hypothetical protein
MKKKDGISFWPQPIFHLDVPLEDNERNVVVIKAMVIIINGIIVVMLH